MLELRYKEIIDFSLLACVEIDAQVWSSLSHIEKNASGNRPTRTFYGKRILTDFSTEFFRVRIHRRHCLSKQQGNKHKELVTFFSINFSSLDDAL